MTPKLAEAVNEFRMAGCPGPLQTKLPHEYVYSSSAEKHTEKHEYYPRAIQYDTQYHVGKHSGV